MVEAGTEEMAAAGMEPEPAEPVMEPAEPVNER